MMMQARAAAQAAAAIGLARFQTELVITDNRRHFTSLLRHGVRTLVELRFFGGLTLDETAAVLGVGTATVSRDWTTARAFLYRELSR
jgi:hypothetical protein